MITGSSYHGSAFLAPASEDAVIGALIRHPEVFTGGQTLTEYDFADEHNRALYQIIRTLTLRNHSADYMSITDEIASRSDCDELSAHLADVLKRAAAKAMYPTHVKLVKDASARRALADTLRESLNRLDDRDTDMSAILEAVSSAAHTAETGSPLTSQTDAAIAAMTLLDTRAKEKPYSTGIKTLDYILAGGLHRGELTIIGARPSVGKTALALWFAVHVAMAGKHVLHISCEMLPNRLILRQIQSGLTFDPAKLRTGKLNDDEWSAISAELNNVASLPITYVERTIEIERMRSEIRAAHANGKCDVVIVDYLQLIRSYDRAIDRNEYTRISYVSRILKELTLELDIPIVALAQVNRSGDREAPTLSELKGSGSIEQDADNVILLHRTQSLEEALPQDREMWPCYINAGYAYLIVNVAKQRDGMIGQFPLLFMPSKQAYVEIQRGGESDENVTM